MARNLGCSAGSVLLGIVLVACGEASAGSSTKLEATASELQVAFVVTSSSTCDVVLSPVPGRSSRLSPWSRLSFVVPPERLDCSGASSTTSFDISAVGDAGKLGLPHTDPRGTTLQLAPCRFTERTPAKIRKAHRLNCPGTQEPLVKVTSSKPKGFPGGGIEWDVPPIPRVELEAAAYIDAPVLFEPDIWNFYQDPQAEVDLHRTLEALVDYLAARPDLFLLVEGHASLPCPDPYNNQLARARAHYVFNELVELVKHSTNAVVVHSRVRHRGFGETQPVVPSAGEVEDNRRVEFRLVKALPDGGHEVGRPSPPNKGLCPKGDR